MFNKISKFLHQGWTKMQAENKPEWTEAEVQEIIKWTRTYIDVPWHHQGRSRRGLDCVGLFWCVAQDIGRPIQIPSNYTHDPDPAILMEHLMKFFDKIPMAQMATGDFLLMRFADRMLRVPNRHIVLKTDLGIIHSAAMYRKVVEHTFDEEWKTRVEHVFRMRRKQTDE